MTKDDILMMARNPYGIYAFTAEDLSKFAELIVQGEREACAKVCEQFMGWDYERMAKCALAIRARGEK